MGDRNYTCMKRSFVWNKYMSSSALYTKSDLFFDWFLLYSGGYDLALLITIVIIIIKQMSLDDYSDMTAQYIHLKFKLPKLAAKKI